MTLAQCVVGKNKDGEAIYWCPCPGCKGQKKRFSEAGLNAHLWSKLNEVGHANEAQWDAWDKEARQGYYVRPALREVRGPDAHCGHDPTWIYLPEEPDYSKHVPESSDSEGGESEDECAEDEAVEETTQETSEEAWGDWGKGGKKGDWGKGGKKDRFKGTPARVEPEGDLPGHRYSSGTSGSVSRSRSPAVKRTKPKKTKKSQGTSPIPEEEEPPSPKKTKKSRGTSPPKEEGRPLPRTARSLYIPPHRRELKAKSKAAPEAKARAVDPSTTRPAEPQGPPPKKRPWSFTSSSQGGPLGYLSPRLHLRSPRRNHSLLWRSTSLHTRGPGRVRKPRAQCLNPRLHLKSRRSLQSRRLLGSTSRHTGGEQQGGPASSSARAPAAYGVTKASRSVLLGEMLSARVARRETLTKSLDDLAEDDPSREAIQTELKELEIVLRNIKDEQRATRKGEKEGHSSRQERDKSDMGGRLAYIKERSRKRAAKHWLETQKERTKENLGTQLTWARRFDQPGAGREDSGLSFGR